MGLNTPQLEHSPYTVNTYNIFTSIKTGYNPYNFPVHHSMSQYKDGLPHFSSSMISQVDAIWGALCFTAVLAWRLALANESTSEVTMGQQLMGEFIKFRPYL